MHEILPACRSSFCAFSTETLRNLSACHLVLPVSTSRRDRSSQQSSQRQNGECSCGYRRNSCIRAVSRNASVPPQSVAENAPHRLP